MQTEIFGISSEYKERVEMVLEVYAYVCSCDYCHCHIAATTITIIKPIVIIISIKE
jgi:hypothetical protein